MSDIPWLDGPGIEFPPIEQALKEPDGLLAIGGDLSTERLLLAYSSGIFPWYDDSQPLLWWSPDPRAVLFTDKLKISRSLLKRLKRHEFQVKLNTCFESVIDACAQPRGDAPDPLLGSELESHTWITQDMREAYLKLHKLGHAQSVECFKDGALVGGLYGVTLGRLFFGESMFHTHTDASKVAFAHLNRLLVSYQCPIIDCQVENAHLKSLGCELISRTQFQGVLQQYSGSKEAIPWQDIPSGFAPW